MFVAFESSTKVCLSRSYNLKTTALPWHRRKESSLCLTKRRLAKANSCRDVREMRCKRMTFLLFLFQKKRVRKRRSKPAKHVLEALQGTLWHTTWINNFFISFLFLLLHCLALFVFSFAFFSNTNGFVVKYCWKWRNLFQKPSND